MLKTFLITFFSILISSLFFFALHNMNRIPSQFLATFLGVFVGSLISNYARNKLN